MSAKSTTTSRLLLTNDCQKSDQNGATRISLTNSLLSQHHLNIIATEAQWVPTKVRTRRARTRMRQKQRDSARQHKSSNRSEHPCLEAIIRISRQSSCAFFLTAGKQCPIFEAAEGMR